MRFNFRTEASISLAQTLHQSLCTNFTQESRLLILLSKVTVVQLNRYLGWRTIRGLQHLHGTLAYFCGNFFLKNRSTNLALLTLITKLVCQFGSSKLKTIRLTVCQSTDQSLKTANQSSTQQSILTNPSEKSKHN